MVNNYGLCVIYTEIKLKIKIKIVRYLRIVSIIINWDIIIIKRRIVIRIIVANIKEVILVIIITIIVGCIVISTVNIKNFLKRLFTR